MKFMHSCKGEITEIIGDSPSYALSDPQPTPTCYEAYLSNPTDDSDEHFLKPANLFYSFCCMDSDGRVTKARFVDREGNDLNFPFNCVFICTPASQAGSLTSGYYGFIGVGLGEAGSPNATFIGATVSSIASYGKVTYPEIASGGLLSARADIAVNITAFPLSGEPDSNFIDSLDA